MKALYVSSDVSAIHVDLLNHLEKRGIYTTLLAYGTKGITNSLMKINSKTVYEREPFAKGPFFFMSRLEDVAKYFYSTVDFSDVQLIHGNMLFEDGYVCRLLSSWLSIPYIVSVRNTDMNLWFFWKLPWIKKMGYKNLESASKIIFLGPAYQRNLLQRVPTRLKKIIDAKSNVIPNGINDFWFKNLNPTPKSLGESIKLITIGRIELNKNQLLTAAAIKQVRLMTQLDIKYVVVGSCVDVQIKRELDKFDFVTVLPYLEKDKLIFELRQCDIYVMPSHTESFGLVYAEAMTQGLPVIYTQGQGFDGQFSDGTVGFSVDSWSVESIRDGIIRAIIHYPVLAKNVLKSSKWFQWDEIISRIGDVYQSSIIHK